MAEPKRVAVLYNQKTRDSQDYLDAVIEKIKTILKENEGKSFILTLEEGEDIGI